MGVNAVLLIGTVLFFLIGCQVIKDREFFPNLMFRLGLTVAWGTSAFLLYHLLTWK